MNSGKNDQHEHHLHGLRHLEAHAHGKHHRFHDVLDAVLVVLTLVIVVYLWPASLGGSTHFVVVQGHSMEPTFHLGDVVVARTNDDPKVGQIIVYEVPKSSPAAGMLIIHRVKAVWPDGTLQTQGDNRKEPDPFHITAGDVMGTPVRAIPHLGRLIGLSSSPLIVAAAAGLLTVFVLWPDERAHKRARRERRKAKRANRRLHRAPVSLPSSEDSPQVPNSIDPLLTPAAKTVARLDDERDTERDALDLSGIDVEAQAQRWLDEQLASLSFD
jgi:signal peptidase